MGALVRKALPLQEPGRAHLHLVAVADSHVLGVDEGRQPRRLRPRRLRPRGSALGDRSRDDYAALSVSGMRSKTNSGSTASSVLDAPWNQTNNAPTSRIAAPAITA